MADDLDLLLDSALDDFSKLDLVSGGSSVKENAPKNVVLGLGGGLPDPKARRTKGKQLANSSSPFAGSSPAIPARANHASEALEKLTKETREAVRGLESATADVPVVPAQLPVGFDSADFNNDAMVEEFMKHFEELSGSQNMESMVETMMAQLLSKEVLYDPMKEIAEKYPKWLMEHKNSLKQEDYDRYQHQYGLILKLLVVYEEEPNNNTKIFELMQKMQECGQPPNDIVRELAPDLDLNSPGQLSPEQLESNCCMM